jgi:hypothetical protein
MIFEINQILTPTTPRFSNNIINNKSLENMFSITKQIIINELKTAGGVRFESWDKFSELANRLRWLYKNLEDKMNYTENENKIAQILLLRFYKLSGRGLSIFRNNVDFFFILVVSLLISHKIINDKPFSNSFWCKENVANVDINTLNDCEIFFLKKIDYSVEITEKDYEDHSNN